jgi:CelD/BcsL family acetyltransferase involved in cellulose biosynthesis
MDRLSLVRAVTGVALRAYDSIEALPADAAKLFEVADGLFQAPAWWRTVLADGMPPRCRPCFLLAYADAAPAALFPLSQPVSGGALSSLTTPYTCLYMPLLAPGLNAATQAAIFTAFARYCRGWATTRLDALPEDWPPLAACVRAARAQGLVPLRFAHFGNWHEVVCGTDWPGYLARRPGALRETIRRKLRRAEQRADAAFCVLSHPDELEPGIAAFEQVYARSWKQPEPYPRFNAGLMRECAAAGMLRLGLWRVGATPAAAQIWVVQAGTATVLKLAHDAAFQAESPGTVLTALMLRRLLEADRVDIIDFGRGDDPYKQGWASQRRQRIGLILANPRRPAGLRCLAQHALGRARGALRPHHKAAAGQADAARQSVTGRATHAFGGDPVIALSHHARRVEKAPVGTSAAPAGGG